VLPDLLGNQQPLVPRKPSDCKSRSASSPWTGSGQHPYLQTPLVGPLDTKIPVAGTPQRKHCLASVPDAWRDPQMHARGGAPFITSWGKFWLAVLGCFSWEGMHPLTPEMWLLPSSAWTGIGWLHPGRYWCHCRMVYLPMAYVYGVRGTGPITDLVLSLRCALRHVSGGHRFFAVLRSLVVHSSAMCVRQMLHPLAEELA
jgi:Squalene-hopene cyclase N-terminal domain